MAGMSQIPPPVPDRLDPKQAALAAFSGYFIWGLSPIFYKFLAFANPTEIVLQRVVWSAPILLAILYVSRRLGPALAVLNDRKTLLVLVCTSLLIGTNWWVYIFSVNSGHVLEASLGYYINPLMNVAVGVLVAHERFSRLRAIAIGLAVLEVIEEEGLQENARVVGSYLKQRLERLGDTYPIVGTVHGSGLYLGLEFVHATAAPDTMDVTAYLSLNWQSDPVLSQHASGFTIL